jgi:hypothetical protein
VLSARQSAASAPTPLCLPVDPDRVAEPDSSGPRGLCHIRGKSIMYSASHQVPPPINGMTGELIDGSGTINPAALNSGTLCLFICLSISSSVLFFQSTSADVAPLLSGHLQNSPERSLDATEYMLTFTRYSLACGPQQCAFKYQSSRNQAKSIARSVWRFRS